MNNYNKNSTQQSAECRCRLYGATASAPSVTGNYLTQKPESIQSANIIEKSNFVRARANVNLWILIINKL